MEQVTTDFVAQDGVVVASNKPSMLRPILSSLEAVGTVEPIAVGKVPRFVTGRSLGAHFDGDLGGRGRISSVEPVIEAFLCVKKLVELFLELSRLLEIAAKD